MNKRWLLSACLAMVFCGNAARADEGMWLYNAVPKDKIKARYGFDAKQEWLDHVRLSSVRFPNGSGSFVSPNGLIMTNHHIGAGCVHDVSTDKKDYMKLGFYAPTQAEEVRCPGLAVNVLQSIDDITDKVNAVVKPGMAPADINKAQSELVQSLVKECQATGLNCEAVSFYSGAVRHIYKFKMYKDVRLVFAPEFQSAFYGGDPDNFEFPRFALDLTMLRAYENDKPAQVDHYLKWSPNGTKENDLVFVSGHPGSTGRLLTMAELEYLRDVQYPLQMKSWDRQIATLLKLSAVSEENARKYERQLFSLQNSLKATRGYHAGLLDKDLMAKKAADEQRVRKAVLSDPKLKAQFGDPWADIDECVKFQRENGTLSAVVNTTGGMGGRLANAAATLVLLPSEKAKPVVERIRALRNAAGVEKDLLSDMSFSRPDEELAFANALNDIVKFLPGNPLIARVLNGKTPEQLAKEVIAGTRVDDLAVRKQLIEGGQAAIDSSTDPLIVLQRDWQAEVRKYLDEYQAKLRPLEERRRIAAVDVAKARFAVDGLSTPPDANFTLRLSYGAVKGYVEDGLGTMVSKGTKVSPYTTFGQAFSDAAKHADKDPYIWPESWTKAKNKINLKTPLVLATTNDIIGGNSGSPMINQKGEVVGLIFDGNMQSLPGRFSFDEQRNRSLAVDSRGMMEAMRSIYNAGALIDELIGKAKSKTAAAGK